MARSLTARDAHAIINSVAKQATGQTTLTATDASSFVSVGETILATGMENTLNALSIVLGKTFMAVRPYSAKLNIINAEDSNLYNTRKRKISFYSKNALESGDWNTQLNTNLADGYDNGSNGGTSTASMWEQHQPIALEMNFAGQSVWEDSITRYENQVKQAFRSEDEFIAFISGVMTEKENDIESQKEAFNRMNLLNYVSGLYDMSAGNYGPRAIDLVAGYNAKFGTSYTGSQLRTTYLKSFLEYFISVFKYESDMMEERSLRNHWSPTKTVGGDTYDILRHTPKADQRAILYNPLFIDAEAMVMPEIFNDRYLKLNQGERINFWQSQDTPAGISFTPAIPDAAGTNNGEQTSGAAVALDYVVGVLYDKDALVTDFQFEAANATPLEARKRYYNIWWSFSKNAINDFTENGILFYMAS